MRNTMNQIIICSTLLGMIATLSGCSYDLSISVYDSTSDNEQDSQGEENQGNEPSIELEGTQWKTYRSEFHNPDGYLSEDGRGMDEWGQTISFDENHRVTWVQKDYLTNETSGELYGTYEVEGNTIIAKADDNDYSTVKSLTFEILSMEELKLEYPENTYTYFKKDDSGDWQDNYVSISTLMNTSWQAISEISCVEACEESPVNTENHLETVSFHQDGTVHWRIYNSLQDEIGDEIDGYWWIEGEMIVVSKNENVDENDFFDIQYFTYEDGKLRRNSGGAIIYIFEEK